MRAANAHIDARFEFGALGTGQASFYTRLGWRPWRGSLAVRTDDGEIRTAEEEGFVWFRATPRTPADLDPDAALTCEWRPGDVW